MSAASAKKEKTAAPLPPVFKKGWSPLIDDFGRLLPHLPPTSIAFLLYLIKNTVGVWDVPERPEWLDATQAQIATAIKFAYSGLPANLKLLATLGIIEIVADKSSHVRHYRVVYENLPAITPKKIEAAIAETWPKQEPKSVEPAEIGPQPVLRATMESGVKEKTAALRVTQVLEPLVLMPGEEHLRPLSELCSHAECEPAKRQRSSLTSCEINGTDGGKPTQANKQETLPTSCEVGPANSPVSNTDNLRRLKEVLETKLAPVPYANWVEPLRLIDERAGTLFLGVQNEAAKEALEVDYAEQVAAAIRGVKGIESVVYEVQQSAATSQSEPSPAPPTPRQLIDQAIEEQIGPSMKSPYTQQVGDTVHELMTLPFECVVRILQQPKNQKALQRGGNSWEWFYGLIRYNAWNQHVTDLTRSNRRLKETLAKMEPSCAECGAQSWLS